MIENNTTVNKVPNSKSKKNLAKWTGLTLEELSEGALLTLASARWARKIVREKKYPARMPTNTEIYTESAVALAFNLKPLINGSGDLIGEDGQIHEVKGSMIDLGKYDCTSFSPKFDNDNLWFVDIVIGIDEDAIMMYIYSLRDVGAKTIKKIVMNSSNKDENGDPILVTFSDQQEANRRPRLSLRKIITENDIPRVAEVRLGSEPYFRLY